MPSGSRTPALSASHQTGPSGLSWREAKRRLRRVGPNEIQHTKPRSAWKRFFNRFKNPLILILIVAALISGGTGQMVDASIIFSIVFLSAALEFFTTYKAERAAEALKQRVAIKAEVIREGVVTELAVTALVPGDVVYLKPGDVIPADGRVLETSDFFVNESLLTGESLPVEKRRGAEVVMGSSAVSGSATMEIVRTGIHTTFSHLALSLDRREEPTEFDRGMNEFSLLILRITVVLVVFVFFTMTVFKHQWLDGFLFAIALAVGLTPELLPMILALNLSKGSLALSKHGVIVKKLSAIQNFGNMDVLCSDKTGTLTEDEIRLVKYTDEIGGTSAAVLRYAYISSAYHTGFVNPFDTAVKKYRCVDLAGCEKITEIPFDFLRRRASMVVREQGKALLITKGAPEEVLQVCRYVGEGHKSLTISQRDQILATYHRLSAQGFRVLALATRNLPPLRKRYSKQEEQELCLRGFISFLDPPKQTATETIRFLARHGVETKIMTGDSEVVTLKVAREIALPVKGVLLGQQLEKMSDAALAHQVERTTIFARVNPIQKERLLRVLQRNGHVVGYLGDGINDAPSLQAADVGISVDTAVDVAKDSADLILLKKDLRDLGNGVIEGRRIFANTLKYLFMDLSSNFGNMFSMALASLFLPFLPMMPTQILLNNLLYDASQCTIPLDTVDAREVRRPRRLQMKQIKTFMYLFGALSSLFDLVTFFVLYRVLHLTPHVFQTGWFLESLTTQTLVVYVIRTKQIPFLQSSPSRVLLVGTSLVVLLGWLVTLTSIGRYFDFAPLSGPVIASIGFIVVMYLFLAEITKRWLYPRLQRD